MAVALYVTGILPVNSNGYGPATSDPASAVVDFTANEIIVDCQLKLSGSYGTASSHGDTLDFTSVNPKFSMGEFAPVHWEIKELIVAGAAGLGYTYEYHPGPTLAAPTQAGGVLYIAGTGAGSGQGGVEITEAGAYSTFTPSLDGAILKARFWFYRL